MKAFGVSKWTFYGWRQSRGTNRPGRPRREQRLRKMLRPLVAELVPPRIAAMMQPVLGETMRPLIAQTIGA